MNTYNLGGHSGCHIYLIEDDDGPAFVRKISKNQNYNMRLREQCRKQANYHGESIKTPKVLKCDINEDGLFFFDMEYIQGVTLAEYIKTIEIGKIKGLVKTLADNLIPKCKVTVSQDMSAHISAIFLKKIRDLRMNISEKENPVINQSLDLLEKHDWTALVASPCHGDMTLENIIVKDDQLYFIDFLDSFYDSWLLDIGTLLQDVQVMWSYRYDKIISMNTVLRLIVFRDLLIDELQKIDKQYKEEMYYSLLQKLIRIYPYTKDKLTSDFLNKKTAMVLNTLHKMEEQANYI